MQTRVIQKQLIVLVHSEGALTDQEDDETDCENSEDHGHYRGKETAIRLPKKVGEKIRDILAPDAAWEVS